MSQNYYVSAMFSESNMEPHKILTINQKNVNDPMTKLIGAVNAILQRTTITVGVAGTDDSGEHISIPVELKIVNIPFWFYIQASDILVAPFITDKLVTGLMMIEEAKPKE